MSYLNPVYPHTCPDPFVFKYAGQYWCYFTGIQPDDRCFGILHSPDLVNWTYQGSALDRLPGGHTCYWAPEAVYQDGVFYFYYSVGDEKNMQIRVATAEHPAGPFIDSGRRLTSETFAIDAHVLIDDDGQWYLFYAADFLDVERVGTGTVMDRMLDPFTLAGQPQPVTLAKHDWQIYDPNRAEKGGLRWHTVEGPFVLKHNGRYYQMFSGGNWQNDTYGVAYGLTDRLDVPGEWHQPLDGVQEPLVLRTLRAQGIIGPGHNSVVRGPDNRQLYCVYHRWQPETDERVLAIDPLGWRGDRLYVDGPSSSAQPGPSQPNLAGFSSFTEFAGASGVWQQAPGGQEWLLSTPGEPARVAARVAAHIQGQPFLLEVWLRFAEGQEAGEAGVSIDGPGGSLLEIRLAPGRGEVLLSGPGGAEIARLPQGFAPQAYHLLRIEATRESTRVSIDENRQVWQRNGLFPASGAAEGLQVALLAQQASLAWAGFAVTELD